MNSEEITKFLRERIDARDFPSAVYLIAEKGEIIFADALGFAVVEPERIEAKVETIYDLASLTKPLVTGLLCAKLIERGAIDLFDKIGKYFAEFDSDEKREITIENLLTHTSGFSAWKPFYLLSEMNQPPSLTRGLPDLIARMPLENPPHAKVVYSDLNFITLGCLLEKIFGAPLDEIARKEIFEPLNLRNTFFNPPFDLKKQIAASENGNFYEKQTCLEQGYEIRTPHSAFRTQTIWGEVHDGNCYFMQGVSGHAGLFSTAFETCEIAQQFLASETKLLKPETCRSFHANLTPGLNEARALAFQLAETPESTASAALARNSFGHLGFTGTSLWVEPESERIFILLTNRTHARALPFVNINSVRRRFHESAAAILDCQSPN